MTRLPTVGADSNTWGTILNAFLSVAHNADGSITNLFFNVKDPAYGAKGDGVTDDTSAIQAAITAAQNAGGGTVYFPATANSYLISSTLTVSADNIELVGASWGAQIKASGAITGNMLQVQGPGGAGNFRYGIRIANLFFHANSIASLNVLDLVSTYQAELSHVRIRFAGTSSIGVHWDGISGAFGAYNDMINCHITDGGAGAIAIQTDNSEWLSITGGHIGTYTGAGCEGIRMQNNNSRVVGVGFDNIDTAFHYRFANRGSLVGCQFDRGVTRFIQLEGSKACEIVGNTFNTFSGTPSKNVIDVLNVNNDANSIANNSVSPGTTWTNFISEAAGIGGANQYIGNKTGGLPIVLQSGSGVARANPGYNPVGFAVAQPAVPASTVNATNNSGVDCEVHIAGGTLTAVTIGGTATGITAAAAAGSVHTVRVPAGQTINITYTVAPTWKWYGD